MAVLCELCNEADSKYRCPACGLRYCSIACYKPHKAQHEESKAHTADTTTIEPTQARVDRPGTTRRVQKQSFAGFEQDAEFQRLLQRYPKLQIQLQGVYALTMDPGPEEERGWNRPQLPLIDRSNTAQRGGRGRGRFMTRGRGGRSAPYEPPEGRQRGRWSKEKGDLEAMFVMRKVQDESSSQEMSDGMQEFVELVRMRYGDRKDA
ncbi:hypothetical protein AMS68_002626 [Peltaster fructicola]|uniref:HIT-type domain-containing protein n=1 Tax=Peltaster fructicola TaxID=286661 RepID=A0A6H0XR56_9PEZI|nr:hypothetical protein AMS68_002626 [Peltaster fructicola]